MSQSTFQHNSVLISTNVLQNLLKFAQLSPVTPLISEIFLSQQLQSNAKLVPPVDRLPVKCVPRWPHRSEVGRSWRPQNQHVSSYPFFCVVTVTKVLHIAHKMSRSSNTYRPSRLVLSTAKPPGNVMLCCLCCVMKLVSIFLIICNCHVAVTDDQNNICL